MSVVDKPDVTNKPFVQDPIDGLAVVNGIFLDPADPEMVGDLWHETRLYLYTNTADAIVVAVTVGRCTAGIPALSRAAFIR